MKLLVIGSDRNLFVPGSQVRSRVVEQAEALDEMHIVVFAPQSGHFQVERLSDRVVVYPTQSRVKAMYLIDALLLGIKIVRNDRESWIVSAQDPFESGIVALLVSTIRRIGLHVQLHTDPFSAFWRELSPLNHVRSLLTAFILRRADGIRVVSDRVCKRVIELGVDPALVVKVPIYVPVHVGGESNEKTDLPSMYPGHSKIILSVGRLEKEKDFPTLLRAFRRVREVYEDALLLLIGSGREHDELIELSESLGIDEHFHILPWTHDIGLYYRFADCYVQPSLYEGWGMAVIEAMAAGVPVIMTDVGCAGEVLIHEETGLVVTPGESVELADAILRMLGDNELRATLTLRAIEKVRNLATKQETLELYRTSWENTLRTYRRAHTPN